MTPASDLPSPTALQLDKARESLRNGDLADKAAGYLLAADASLRPGDARTAAASAIGDQISETLKQSAFRCEQMHEFGGLVRLLAVIYAVNRDPGVLKRLLRQMHTSTQPDAAVVVARLMRDLAPQLSVDAARANFSIFLATPETIPAHEAKADAEPASTGE